MGAAIGSIYSYIWVEDDGEVTSTCCVAPAVAIKTPTRHLPSAYAPGTTPFCVGSAIICADLVSQETVAAVALLGGRALSSNPSVSTFLFAPF